MAARCEWFGQLRQPQLPGALQFLVGNSDPDGQVVKLGFAPLLDGLDLLALGVAKEKQRLIGRSEDPGRALLDLEPERPEPGFRFEADSDFLGQRRMLGHEAVMLVLHRIELRIEPSVEQGVVVAALLVKRTGQMPPAGLGLKHGGAEGVMELLYVILEARKRVERHESFSGGGSLHDRPARAARQVKRRD